MATNQTEKSDTEVLYAKQGNAMVAVAERTPEESLPSSCAGCAKDIRHFTAEARDLGWCPSCAPECYPLGDDA